MKEHEADGLGDACSPSGLLVVDVSDMAKPTVTHTARTSRIVVNSDDVYAPLDMYGLQQY